MEKLLYTVYIHNIYIAVFQDFNIEIMGSKKLYHKVHIKKQPQGRMMQSRKYPITKILEVKTLLSGQQVY
jgi:hypothetical protein